MGRQGTGNGQGVCGVWAMGGQAAGGRARGRAEAGGGSGRGRLCRRRPPEGGGAAVPAVPLRPRSPVPPALPVPPLPPALPAAPRCPRRSRQGIASPQSHGTAMSRVGGVGSPTPCPSLQPVGTGSGWPVMGMAGPALP